MPPGYKVCCAPTILRLVLCHCSCFSLPIGALRRSFRRLNGGLSPSISSYYPPCHYTARCIFRCQAYGPIARVRLETSHRWCGAADGMCIETNSKPDGFCVSFVDRYLRTNILCSSDPSFVCHSVSIVDSNMIFLDFVIHMAWMPPANWFGQCGGQSQNRIYIHPPQEHSTCNNR